jgi:hypothetical protein
MYYLSLFMASSRCFLRFALLIVSLSGLHAYLTSTLTPTNHLWSLQNKKTSHFLFRRLNPCRAASLRAFSIQAKDDIPTLKQNLLNLCEQSQRGLVPFDLPSKQRFEALVSGKEHFSICHVI